MTDPADPYGQEMPGEEEIIEEFLGENPRARELRMMRSALEARRDAVLRERSRATVDRERIELGARVGEINRQIETLRQEEAITSFVENSVRASVHRSTSVEMDEEE